MMLAGHLRWLPMKLRRAACVPQPSLSWHPQEHGQRQLPNEPMQEGDSAPLATHLLKGKGAHPSLDPLVFVLHAPFGKSSGIFDIKTRLGGAGQGGGEKAMFVVSLRGTSLVQALSCHPRSAAVVSKHSPCCLDVLPPCPPVHHGLPASTTLPACQRVLTALSPQELIPRRQH